MAETNATDADSDPRVGMVRASLNEILLETGKALRSVRSAPLGDVSQVANVISSSTRAQFDSLHDALMQLELETKKARVVLVRDLLRIRARKALPLPPPAGPHGPAIGPEITAGPENPDVLMTDSSGQPSAQANPHEGDQEEDDAEEEDDGDDDDEDEDGDVDIHPLNSIAPFPDMGSGPMTGPLATMDMSAAVPKDGLLAGHAAANLDPVPAPHPSSFTNMQFTLSVSPHISQPNHHASAFAATGGPGNVADGGENGNAFEDMYFGDGVQKVGGGQFDDAYFGMG